MTSLLKSTGGFPHVSDEVDCLYKNNISTFSSITVDIEPYKIKRTFTFPAITSDLKYILTQDGEIFIKCNSQPNTYKHLQVFRSKGCTTATRIYANGKSYSIIKQLMIAFGFSYKQSHKIIRKRYSIYR